MWPGGTTWDADRLVVELTNGQEIPVGGSANGAGGYFDPEDVGPIAGAEAREVAERCSEETSFEIAIVNNLDKAILPD